MNISNYALLDSNVLVYAADKSSPHHLKIYQSEVSFQKLVELIARYKVKKQEVFDLQIVSTMLANNINKIYTFNMSDFSKFKDIKVLLPQ